MGQTLQVPKYLTLIFNNEIEEYLHLYHDFGFNVLPSE